MKTIILLGGSGYVGTHLMETWLSRDDNIRFISISRNGELEYVSDSVLNSDRVEWMKGNAQDITNLKGKLPKDVDGIIDLVGTATGKDLEEFEATNVAPVYTMLQLMDELTIPKGAYLSGIMGMPGKGKLFIDTKKAAEELIQKSEKNILIFWPSLIYGDRQGVGVMIVFMKLMGVFNKKYKPILIDDLAEDIIREFSIN